MENFSTLANNVFNQLNVKGEILHNDDSSIICIPLENHDEIYITFEDDDYDDYARVHVEYKIFGKTNEVGVYSLIRANDIECALKSINTKVDAIRHNYKLAKQEIAKLTDILPPLATDMLKNML